MDTQGYLSIKEVREALRRIYRSDQESDLSSALLELFSDELRPIDQKGRRRLSSLLMISIALLCAFVLVFLFFSAGVRG